MMNWFVCILGLLSVATIVCLCLHQYQKQQSNGMSTAETYVDYTGLYDKNTEESDDDSEEMTGELTIDAILAPLFGLGEDNLGE